MNILIVESAAKARTLGRYLGQDWKVLATGGHVQTLPNDRKIHGKDAKKAYWSSSEGNLPKPPWVWTDRGQKAIKAIVDAPGGKRATFWLATDPDREGEFIAWRLEELLKEHGKTHRVTFHEVTKEAVQDAVANPRDVDMDMVRSALVRKFLDRLVGFRTSKLARGVLKGGSASMGRVQTPTLGFVVERELEREAHIPIAYFEVRALAAGIEFQVQFSSRGDQDAWRDEAGRANTARTSDKAKAEQANAALSKANELVIAQANTRDRSVKPKPPFTTDTLLQAAGSRFGWSPRKTSALASMLYEAGHITYIRTDSVRLADTAVAAAKTAIKAAFGADHLGTGTTTAPAAKGPVQDAHEAIRPTKLALEEVAIDDKDAQTLYKLIRAQVLASLMAPSTHRSVQLTTRVDGLPNPLRGNVSWRTFAGWEAAMAPFMRAATLAPPKLDLSEGGHLTLASATEEEPNPRLIEDATKPPARYRAHTLIKTMKDAGIGRPSTYAKTVDKLTERTYLTEESGALVPTERGRAGWLLVAPLYVAPDNDVELFSADFTAAMEERLDEVAGGDLSAGKAWTQWRDTIRDLHEQARARRSAGNLTPRTRDRLLRLLANTPDGVERPPEDLDSLTEAQGRDWASKLTEAGVQPAPAEKQRAYAQRLMDDLDMDGPQAAALVDASDMDAIKTSAAFSSLIDQLKTLHDERRPPSRKQLGLIKRLLDKAEMTAEEAAKLVEVENLDALTGGRQGSASALIDVLLERTSDKKSKG